MFIIRRFEEEKPCLLCEETIKIGAKGIAAQHGCVCEPCIKKEGFTNAVMKLFGIKPGTAKSGVWEFTKVTIGECWGIWKEEGGKGNLGGFEIDWAAKGIGFGQATFCTTLDGKIEVQTENMGKDFVLAAFAHMLQEAEMVE